MAALRVLRVREQKDKALRKAA